MTARRDRAVTNACLIALGDVLAEGRWPADGRDLLAVALELTERRTLAERVRAVRGAEMVLWTAALAFAFAGDYAHDRWGVVAGLAYGAAGICLYNTGAAAQTKYETARPHGRHR